MVKILLGLLMALCTALALAATEANQASQSELETVKGIGPAMSGRILDERKKAQFKDWPDLIDRVKGVGDTNAQRYSEAGLTVNGQTYAGGARTKAVSKKVPAASAAAANEKK
ncbi:MAG: hypothetical protein RJA44_1547 [Pseudomonadota bacterium]|jgi:competence protein ComEA